MAVATPDELVVKETVVTVPEELRLPRPAPKVIVNVTGLLNAAAPVESRSVTLAPPDY